jgi:hypothetical protein
MSHTHTHTSVHTCKSKAHMHTKHTRIPHEAIHSYGWIPPHADMIITHTHTYIQKKPKNLAMKRKTDL